MKKVIFLILFFIAFNSINSIAKYSNIVEYNFLTVNILLVEIINQNSNSYTKNSSKSLPNKYNLPNTHTVNTYINSDVFIDTNTNIQIQITK